MAETSRQRGAREQRQLNADIRAIADTPAGLRLIRALLAASGVTRSTFSADSDRVSAFREGERNTGLRLLAWLDEADPAIYLRIIQSEQEQKDRERIERERSRAGRGRDDGSEPDADPAG